MSEALTVADDRVVSFHYVLRDDAGQVLDASQEEPMAYLHGHGQIVPGLERQLVGRGAGDQVQAVVAPEDAYGVIDDQAYQSVHRSEFPKGMDIQLGMPIRAQGSDGRPMVLWVDRVEGARVTLTTNHPLAGKTLHFEVRVEQVREATADELAHGHAHGPGGHHH